MSLRQQLLFMNDHWHGLPKVPSFRREYFATILQNLQLKRVLTLIGPRRVGKTTLLKQLIVHLTSENTFKPSQILFFSFEKYRDAPFNLLEPFSQLTGTNTKSENVLLIFDEIQYVENWGAEIKFLFDNLPNGKIIISGSSSADLNRGQESLAGREVIIRVDPLSFEEYLTMKEISTTIPAVRYTHYLEYMDAQLPELALDSSLNPNLYIRELVDKAINYDLQRIYRVDYPEKLIDLFSIIVSNPGQILVYADLASELQVDQRLIAKYLTHLEEVLLIRRVPKFTISKNPRKRYLVSKRSARFYPYFTSLHHYATLVPVEFGLKAETEVAFKLQEASYWNEKGLKEIDFIILRNEKLIGIEVKIRRHIRKKDVKWLLQSEFLDEKVLVITNDTDFPPDLSHELLILPLSEITKI